MNENIASRLLREHRDFVSAVPVVDVEGLSSSRVCRFLNALVANLPRDEIYVEIGTWKGKTLLSAARGNRDRLCIGCDKFRFLGRFTGLGCLAKRALERNIARYERESAEVRFFAETSREFFARERPPRSIGVYFYDGDHTYDGTHHGVVAAAPFLAERSVVLVDDWNDPVIRRATFDGLRLARLEILWRRALPGDHGDRGFWNGLGAFFVEKRVDALRAFPASRNETQVSAA